jgi:hypothetical protein
MGRWGCSVYTELGTAGFFCVQFDLNCGHLVAFISLWPVPTRIVFLLYTISYIMVVPHGIWHLHFLTCEGRHFRKWDR